MPFPSRSSGVARSTTEEGCVFTAVVANAQRIANLPDEFATYRHPRRLCRAWEEAAHVRSAGFSRNSGEQPPKGGTTNVASHAACAIEPAKNSAAQGDTADTRFRRRWRFFIIATAVLILMA